MGPLPTSWDHYPLQKQGLRLTHGGLAKRGVNGTLPASFRSASTFAMAAQVGYWEAFWKPAAGFGF